MVYKFEQFTYKVLHKSLSKRDGGKKGEMTFLLWISKE